MLEYALEVKLHVLQLGYWVNHFDFFGGKEAHLVERINLII